MFKEFYETWKKDIEQLGQISIAKLQEKFDEMWNAMVGDLEKTKIQKEEEVKQIDLSLKEKNSELQTLSNNIVKFKEAEKALILVCDDLKVKNEKLAEIYQEKNGLIQGISDREKLVEAKEKEQKENDLRFTARERIILEKEKSLKRIFN